MLMSGKNPDYLEENINKELTSVYNWFTKNSLTIHPGKTKFMVFNNKTNHNFKIMLNGNAIDKIGENEEEKSFKYVGVHIDERLTFKYHKNEIISKLRRNLGLITTNKYLPKNIKILIYNSLLKPYLEYAICIWGLSKNNDLEKLQRKILRLINNAGRYSHTAHLFEQNKILQIQDLISLNTIKLLQEFFTLKLPKRCMAIFNKETHKINTRRSLKVNLLKEDKSNSWTNKISRIYNNQDDQFKLLTDPKKLKEGFKGYKLNIYRETKCTKNNCYSCKQYEKVF